MKLDHRIRQFHRWVSLAFTMGVIVNIVVMTISEPATWVGLLALFPLILLMVTGLYLFMQPYTSRLRDGRRVDA